jgi:hypothetical protein
MGYAVLGCRKRIEAQGFVDLDEVTGGSQLLVAAVPGDLHGMGGSRDGPILAKTTTIKIC